MCGRFVVYGLMDDIVKVFNARRFLSVYKPNYNVAPGQNIPVLVNSGKEGDKDGNKDIDMFRWGLVPSWVKDDKMGLKMINARAEGIEQKPSYKRPFQSRRCLIIANGFYEWKDKQPHYITLKDRGLFGMAGLYDEWIHDNKVLKSCSIITTAPNRFMEKIHDRMPVIIAKDDENDYLTDIAKARILLKPSDEEFQSWKVSNRMNSPSFNTESCIKPMETTASLDEF